MKSELSASNIVVRYAGQVAQVAGTNEERVGINGACAAFEVLLGLANRHGDALRRMIFNESNQVHLSVLLFVNDEQVRPEFLLKDGDTLLLLTPMAGG